MLKRIRRWYDELVAWCFYDLCGKPRPLFGYIEDGHAYVVYSSTATERAVVGAGAMKDSPPTYIRIYTISEDGSYRDEKMDFGGVLANLDRRNHRHRGVWTVAARYFHPATSSDDHCRYIVLVCHERREQEFEANIVTKH